MDKQIILFENSDRKTPQTPQTVYAVAFYLYSYNISIVFHFYSVVESTCYEFMFNLARFIKYNVKDGFRNTEHSHHDFHSEEMRFGSLTVF